MIITNRKDIVNKIYKIINDILMYAVTEEQEDIKLSELGFNSMNFVKLGVFLEEEFNISFSLEELDFSNERFSTIKTLIIYIEEKLAYS